MAGSPPDASLFDKGLQLERTHLAWSRTALAFAVNAILMARFSRHLDPSAPGVVLAAALGLVGAAAWWHGRSAYAHRSAALIQGHRPLQLRVVRVIATATTVLLFAVTAVALCTTAT